MVPEFASREKDMTRGAERVLGSLEQTYVEKGCWFPIPFRH